MTKQEAYKKLNDCMRGKPIKETDIPFSQFCDYLEALGLIQFDKKDLCGND